LTRRHSTIAIRTAYWKPGYDYLTAISRMLAPKVQTRDVIVMSEKAISVADGHIVDEAQIHSGVMVKLIARFWMRFVWGYLLGPICHLSRLTISRLRSYPLSEGAAHKQLALHHVGFLQALRHGSEGGIDTSNVPYSYASLPLKHPDMIARNILEALLKASFKDITVLIVDSDKTYTSRGIHISSRPTTVQGILALGVIGYVLCRSLKLRARSTPIAQAGHYLRAEEALRIAALANRARGSGRTAWDMAEQFGVGLTSVSWESLGSIEHRPVVIVREISQ